jgi:Domain of unknown function (DUF1840)
MIYKFKSSAGADVLMQRFNAEQMLAIINKKPAAIGVISVAEMSEAIAILEAEINRQEHLSQSSVLPSNEDLKKYEPERLRERMAPLIDLLRVSEKAKADVVWGI